MISALNLYALRETVGGVVFDGGRRWVGPGPGHSRRDASLSVWISDEGRALVHSFAGDDFKACAAHIGLSPDAHPPSPIDLSRARRERDVAERRRADEAEAWVANVWAGAIPIEGSPADAYLHRRRLAHRGGVLRWHPACPRTAQPGPDKPRSNGAMVAQVVSPTGRATGLHATYLTDGGRKAFPGSSRLMFGVCRHGAVRLAPVGQGGVLAIAEGIESAAAFTALHGAPAWAVLSTSGMVGFAPPPNLRQLVIAADNDDSGAGLSAARDLAQRIGRRIETLIVPASPGLDWADELEQAAHG